MKSQIRTISRLQQRPPDLFLLQGRESIAKQCSTGIVRATVGLTLTTGFGSVALVEVPETDAHAIDKIWRDGKGQG
jgi:hypothetical protein